MAAVTKRAQISSLVICNSYRTRSCSRTWRDDRPHSGGRFVLGIGSGWFQKDYDEYGYDFGRLVAGCATRSRAAADQGAPRS
jgi:alkanesulfonate monooxygenase SsuD/methylene tetrahydromethanopterin reductase-like flavin-dependent oxidoreductase (luciferase family)